MRALPFIVVSAALVGGPLAGCLSTAPSSDDSGTASVDRSTGSSSGAESSGGSSSGSGAANDAGSSSSSGSMGSVGVGAPSGSQADGGGNGSGSSGGSDSGSSSGAAASHSGDGSVTAVDASSVDGPSVTDSPSPAPDASDAAQARGVGQFTCTLNAATPFHLGAEHRTYWLFGTVIDTTAGANRARVGAIQSFLDINDLLKWVWPNILTTGHTYEIAMFEDHLRSRTCLGADTTAEPQFLLQIPAVTGDFEYKWIAPVPHTASCQDFPSPIP